MPPAAGTGRARQQAKRRNDDAPYQRGGAVADVDQRAKRRKLDITGNNVSAGGYTTAGKRGTAGTGSSDEGVLIQLDLTKLPTEAIYKYLERHDLLPQIVPSPLSNDHPPPPNQLIVSKQSAAHNPYYPNYTRPPPQQQQRSSVLSDEEGLDTTALCDTDIRTPLANLAQAHWVKTTQINENAIINSFCQALRVKDLALRLSS